MSDQLDHTEEQDQRAEIDPAQVQYLQQQLESQQNLVAGSAAGIAASLVGAATWAGLTVATGYQIGFMAIGVGFLVGYAVRLGGKGVTSTFGFVGAFSALLGCALGNLLAVTTFVANDEGMGLLEALPQLTPTLAAELMIATFSPMDLLFYGIAIYEGYRLSFRQLSGDEINTMLTGSNTS